MSRPAAYRPVPDVQGQYAGFATRLAAFVIDRVILLSILALANTAVIIVLNAFNLTLEQLLVPPILIKPLISCSLFSFG